jgi:putative FmdB family regulatory protein
MPTYDYLCPNGHRFEVIHAVTGAGPDACPVCDAAPVRKAVSAPTIHFKGSGWAKKDRSSAARSSSAAAASESAPSNDDGSKTEKPATDAKPTDAPAKGAAPAKDATTTASGSAAAD